MIYKELLNWPGIAEYATELNALSGPAQKEFLASFPRKQCLSKTDVARSRTIFDGWPHIASLGVQKCSRAFAEKTAKAWQLHKKSQSENASGRQADAIPACTGSTIVADFVDETYFIETVAKEILLRQLDKAFGKTPAYMAQRLHKTKTVIYTLARFSHRLQMQERRTIDFNLVWREQDIPDSMRATLICAAIDTHHMLRKHAHGRDVHEVAKKVHTWEALRAKPVEFPESVVEFSVAPGVGRSGTGTLFDMFGHKAA